MDIVSRAVRSRMMSRIRGQDTKPELAVRKALHSAGLRYRLYRKDLPGSPDIVLPRFRTAIVVHGCFWHLHPGCPFAQLPSSNRVFWRNKLLGNRERDKRNSRELRRLGWNVITLWECDLEGPRGREVLAAVIRNVRREGRGKTPVLLPPR